MSETQNRNLPLVDPGQPQREGVARINTALSMIDTDIAALLIALGAKANAADIGPAITAAINALVAGAPAALDTLAEVAAKLAQNDDAVAAIMASLSTKANAANVYSRATVDDMIAAEAQARANADNTLQTAINGKVAKLAWSKKTASFAAAAGNIYLLKHTAAATVTFPATVAEGDRIGLVIEDEAETYTVTIALSGKSFGGATTDVAIKHGVTLIFEYFDSAWRIAA